MDVYKTPKADLSAKGEKQFKPVRAVLFGLGISIILASAISTIYGIVLALALGLDFSNQEAFESELTNNLLFQIGDVVISGLILYFAGRVVGKRTPGKEVKYGIIVSTITFAIYLPLFFATDTFSVWPLWYNLLGIFVIFFAIILGAKSCATS